MSDQIDQAQRVYEFLLANALANRSRCQSFARAMNEVHLCKECGDVIPLARVKAVPQCVRCATCQTQHERRGR